MPTRDERVKVKVEGMWFVKLQLFLIWVLLMAMLVRP